MRDFFFPHGSTALRGPRLLHRRGFTITPGHTTLDRTPVDEQSTRRRALYLKTHNAHKRQTSILPAGFETAVSASEWPQTQALDRAANGTGCKGLIQRNIPGAISYTRHKNHSIYATCLLTSLLLFYLARSAKTLQEERPSY